MGGKFGQRRGVQVDSFCMGMWSISRGGASFGLGTWLARKLYYIKITITSNYRLVMAN